MNGHALQRQDRPACDRCVCDMCGEEIPEGQSLWGCRACNYDKCSRCAGHFQAGQANDASARMELVPGQCAIIRNCPNARLNGERVILEKYNDLGEWTVKGDKFPLSVGMSLGAQFLEAAEPAQSSDSARQAPTLLTGDAHLVKGKCNNSFRALLEKYTAMRISVGDTPPFYYVRVGEYISDVHARAFAIINGKSGLGESGQCPFADAYEVHLFQRFCLNVCVAWSEHRMGNDEQVDKNFYSQISELTEILCFLDTSAVYLPEEIEQNIKVLQSDALFPHWVTAQTPKGEAALERCIAVGRKWGLEETDAFQKALAALENVQGNERM